MNSLGDLANIAGRFPFGSNGVGVDFRPISQWQTALGVLKVLDLREQQAVYGPVWIHGFFRRSGNGDDWHFRVTPFSVARR
jgi:hypothetical protein